ncbi:MAG: hypothetical protein PHF17_07545 [Arcobacteraceae bacterium]|nr:hypothetical protein [Arcobacteraceae bacterium]
MKLFLSCNECSLLDETEYPEFYEIQILDLHKYEFTCKNGHKAVSIIDNPKFEMLFQVGANAIIDGYYREAISSFASSLERFYEICIKTILSSSKIENNTIEKSWKEISNQSERQLGAFTMLWLNFYHEIPELLSNKMTTLRNEVIHKGKIPSRKETINFGKEVFRLITTKLQKIIKEDSYKWLISKCEQVAMNGSEFIATGCIQTIISSKFIDKNYDSVDLEKEIERLQELRALQKRQLANNP